MQLLTPKTDLFKEPDYQLAKISPDSQWISSVQSKDSRHALVLQKTDAMQDSTTLYQAHTILDYWWMHTNRHVLLLTEDQPNNFVLTCCNLDQQKEIQVFRAGIIKWIEPLVQNVNKAVICLRHFESGAYELYLFDAQSGQLQTYYKNELFSEYIIDPDGMVRYGLQITDNGGVFVDVETQRTLPIALNQHDIMLMHRFPEVRPKLSKTHLYYISSDFHDCAFLLSYALKNGAIEALAGDIRSDVSRILYNLKTMTALAACTENEKIAWMGIKDDCSAHFQLLAKYLSTDFYVVSQSLTNQSWIVAHHSDQRPIHYYLYHLPTQELQPLFKEAFKHHANETLPLIIQVRDNTAVPCYLTKTAVHAKAPLVILIHGGPHSRDFWGWQPVHQFLSNRGYHVLSLNYRGSLGFGQEHFYKGYGEWAGKILDDIHDVAQYCVTENLVDAGRIALYGTSFGAFAALMSLVRYPMMYQCAIDLMGPVDLTALISYLPADLKRNVAILNNMLGTDVNAEQAKAYLQSISPLYCALQINKPLLIGHGMKDPVVRYTESLRLIDSIPNTQSSITGVLFQNEGHQLTQLQNRISWYGGVERFLSNLLGGEYESTKFPQNQPVELIRDDLQLFQVTEGTDQARLLLDEG